MGNHFGGVVERVYLGNLSCRSLLGLNLDLPSIPNSSFLIGANGASSVPIREIRG